MDFSILIPAYNAEKYIGRCIESILSQTYTDFEVIIIDDGSYDNTYKLCKQYAEKDPRISIFKQKNIGVASTRNKLIQLAKGEWILFIDADDYIAPQYTEIFKKYISTINSDVYVCDYNITTKTEIKSITYQFQNKEDYLKKLLDWRKINTTLWGKAIRRTLILQTHIHFNPHFNMGEDFCFMSKLFYYANEITHIPQSLYYFNNENPQSITHNTIKYAKDFIEYQIDTEKFYKAQADYCKYKKIIENTKVHLAEHMYVNFNNFPSWLTDRDTFQTFKLLNVGNKIRYLLIKFRLKYLLKIVHIISRKINH